jgi:hypothetical protein
MYRHLYKSMLIAANGDLAKTATWPDGVLSARAI